MIATDRHNLKAALQYRRGAYAPALDLPMRRRYRSAQTMSLHSLGERVEAFCLRFFMERRRPVSSSSRGAGRFSTIDPGMEARD